MRVERAVELQRRDTESVRSQARQYYASCGC